MFRFVIFLLYFCYIGVGPGWAPGGLGGAPGPWGWTRTIFCSAERNSDPATPTLLWTLHFLLPNRITKLQKP